MRDGLVVGTTAELVRPVDPSETIHLGAAGGGVVVFSTPAMIDLMEHAARAVIAPFLQEDEESVGVQVDVEHLAATPIAATVRSVARVTHIDGRLIEFLVEAFDDQEQIGRGTHRRAIIRTDKFRNRLEEKSAALPDGLFWPAEAEANTGTLPALQTLRVESEGAVASVALHRPERANAVDRQMTADWEQVVAWLAGHGETIRVVIVTGSDGRFCAGDDVKEVATLNLKEAEALSHRQARLYLSFEKLPQVLIAAVDGPAMGAGCVCAYSCDFRVASQRARFGMPEIVLGWAPGYGIAQLTALVGKARALELCLTGKHISAQRALEYGLVNDVVPATRLAETTGALAERLLALPPLALRETKRLIHADFDPRAQTTYLADTAAYIRCLATADAREGIAAFMENRPPRFS